MGSATQREYIRRIKLQYDNVPSNVITEVDGYSSDIRKGSMFHSATLYLYPEYTTNPDEAITGLRFEERWSSTGDFGDNMDLAKGYANYVYLVNEYDSNNSNKIIEVKFWKQWSPFSSPPTEQFHGHSSLGVLGTMLLWRTHDSKIRAKL